MSESFLPPRGTSDIYGEDERAFRFVTDIAKNVAENACFEYLHTPIFEQASVFLRGLGETSDVVHKEMYMFEDRGGDSLTLRPEFTASVARAFIAGGFHQTLPVKFFSTGPLFRYERPQKGRRRQFHQINYECYGLSGPETDADMIILAHDLLQDLDLTGNITAEINTLGDKESRLRYREALITFFSRYKNDLSEDSQRRLKTNPLRILDSKNTVDKKISADAPLFAESLSEDSTTFFHAVRSCLDHAGITYTHNPHLVRGLDYYNDTVFEFTTDALGAQNTVLAGGRYDGLSEEAGGNRRVPAIGFAAGIERLAALLTSIPEDPSPVLSVAIGNEALPYLSTFIRQCRATGIPADRSGEGNPKKQFKLSDRRNARFVVIAGSNEIENDSVTLKDMHEGSERTLSKEDALRFLDHFYNADVGEA